MKRFVVLVSGRGSNFKAILDEIQKGNIQGEIVAVISDNHHAKALDIARMPGLKQFLVTQNRRNIRKWLLGTDQSYEPDYVY